MLKNDTYSYKALCFDLRIKSLEKHFSSTNPNAAYNKVQQFMLKHDFSHEQYSGYHSNYKTTDMRIFRLIKLMKNELPWLISCTNRFAVTDVGENYNLMKLLNTDPAILS